MAKTCGFCEKTDGMCYTSNPPKRKCTLTGKFHEYDEEKDDYIVNAGWYEAICNWDDYNAVGVADIVTHWMPLPEPLKMAGGAEDGRRC